MTSSHSSLDRISVLVVHNAYKQRGGEDVVVEAEVDMLRSRGHDVALYSRSNDEVDGKSPAALMIQTVWSTRTYREVASLLAELRPSIVHVHNTLPLVSPSVYWAASEANVPVVQTLHNFRLLCPQALMLRDQRICEECLGRVPWRAVKYRCYRASSLQSAVVGGMVQIHRWLGTWDRHIDRYITLSDFSRDKYIEGGFPRRKLVTKPNFVDAAAPVEKLRSGLLFVGRMAPEKGIETLVAALAQLPLSAKLDAIGDGPLAPLLADQPRVRTHGTKPAHVVREAMTQALALIVPSIWNEPFGMVIVEAFSCGLPVVASRVGAPASMVEHGVTGLLVDPGDPDGLATTLRWALANPAEMDQMGRNARRKFEMLYTSDVNYGLLLDIYRDAIAERLLPRAISP